MLFYVCLIVGVAFLLFSIIFDDVLSFFDFDFGTPVGFSVAVALTLYGAFGLVFENVPNGSVWVKFGLPFIIALVLTVMFSFIYAKFKKAGTDKDVDYTELVGYTGTVKNITGSGKCTVLINFLGNPTVFRGLNDCLLKPGDVVFVVEVLSNNLVKVAKEPK